MSTFDETPFGSSPLPEPKRQETEISYEKKRDLLFEKPTHVNKFYLTHRTDGSIRLVFIDSDDNIEVIRGAIIMTPNAFLSLANMAHRSAMFMFPPKVVNVENSENGEKIEQ